MALPFIVCPALLVALGVLIRLGKAGFLVPGYWLMTPEEKEKVDEKAMFGFLSNLLFISAGILIGIGIVVASGWAYAFLAASIGFIVLIVVVIFALVFWNGGKRFRKK